MFSPICRGKNIQSFMPIRRGTTTTKCSMIKVVQSKENPGWKRDIFISSACFRYPTLPTKELMTLPIETIAEDDALLFMWSTNPHLEQAISLGKSWGFEYKTIAFIWNKMKHNPGQYTLSYCEVCLLFKRGPNTKAKRRQECEAACGGHQRGS